MIILNSWQYLLLIIVLMILEAVFLKVTINLKSYDDEMYLVTLVCACVACVFLYKSLFSPLDIVKEEVTYAEVLKSVEVKSCNSRGIPKEYLITYKGEDGLDKTYYSNANSVVISVSESDTDIIEEIEEVHSLLGNQLGVTLSSYHLYLSTDTYNSLYK